MRREADEAGPFTVFIVDTRASAAFRLSRILSDAGYVATIALSFQDAKQGLDRTTPDLLIADVRLGAYNGLHLVMRTRARSPTTAAIITHSTHDPALEAEARALKAVYLVRPLRPSRLLRVVRRLLEERMTPTMGIDARRWRRKEVAERFVVKIGESHGHVIDVSYGGLRASLFMDGRSGPGDVMEPGGMASNLTKRIRRWATRGVLSSTSWPERTPATVPAVQPAGPARAGHLSQNAMDADELPRS
jgi:CheY-like chemotaxis protein